MLGTSQLNGVQNENFLCDSKCCHGGCHCCIGNVFGVWAIALVSVVSVIMIIAWFADMKFTVTKNDEVVGYYQRSTGLCKSNRHKPDSVL